MRARLLLAAGLATLAAAAPAHASTLTVTGTGDGNGSCMAGACTTLRIAIDQASALMGPDTISLPAGAYTLTGGPIEITSEVTITGPSARTATISTGGARGFSIRVGQTVTIQHLSVAGNGLGNGDGGLIANDGTLTLDHVHLSSGHAANGGAVSNAGTLTIRSSLLDQNVATTGGGAIASTGAAVSISDSTIAFNTSGAGGGAVFLRSGTVTLARTTLAQNIGAAALDLRGTATASASTSLITNNAPSNCSAIKPTDLGGNLVNSSECALTDPTSRVTFSGAAAVPSNAGGETNVLALLAASPAIDIGAPCPDALDQRDFDRGQGTGCDAGAYEVDQPPDTRITTGPTGLTPKLDARYRFDSPEPATFECRLDQPGDPGTFATCTSPFFAATASSGTYTFYVRATDAGGKTDPTPASATFTIQAGAPLLRVTGPLGPTRDASPTFTISSPDFGAAFECTITGTFAPCTSPVTYDDLPDGPFLFLVRVRFDGTVQATNTRGFTIDTGDPETTISSGASGPTNVKDQSFAFSANEDSTFRCRLDGPAGTGAYVSCTSPRLYPGLADGTYSFLAEATDPLGNRDATPARHDFTVDTLAPGEPQMRFPIDGTLQKTTSVLVSVFSELGSTVRVFDNQQISGDTVFSSPVWELTVANLLDGAHVFGTRATDAAGNVSPLSETRTVRIDTVAPPAPVITTPAEGAVVRSSTVTLSGTAEPDSTVGLTGGGTTTATGGAWTFELTNVPDGLHTYSVKATDAAGNTGAAATRTITVDTAPIATATPEATPVPLPAPAPTTTPASTQAPTVLIARVSGKARIKPPGGAFAPLTKSQSVPFGVTVDATKGTVKVSPTAKQSATAKGRVFTVTQSNGLTLLTTTSCHGTFTVDTRTGGFITRTGKLTITARKSAKWRVSKNCRKLTVLRGTVIA